MIGDVDDEKYWDLMEEQLYKDADEAKYRITEEQIQQMEEAKKRSALKQSVITLRVKESEKQELVAKAKQLDLSLSQYLLQQAQKEVVVIEKKKVTVQEHKHARNLALIGNNINQIARWLHKNEGNLHTAIMVTETKNALHALSQQLKKITDAD